MALRYYIFLIILLLTACTQPGKTGSVQTDMTAVVPSERTLDSFRFDWPKTTLQDVIAKVGIADRDIGSGLYILEYRLQDGSKVWIGSTNYSDILYVRHGMASLGQSEIVYGR